MTQLINWLINGLGMAFWGFVFLALLYLCFKKPVDAYLSEKGKNFATKEDFEGISSRLEHTTSITESIKANFSANSWLGQQHWNSQDKHYTAVLKNLAEAHNAYYHARGLLKIFYDTSVPDDQSKRSMEQAKVYLDKTQEHIGNLRVSYASACIYFNEAAKDAVSLILQYEVKFRSSDSMIEGLDQKIEELGLAMERVQESAVAELRQLKLMK